MRLEVITPARIVLDRTVTRLVAEAPDGFFGILPGHGDFVTEIVAGILVFQSPDDTESFIALDAGTLVKCGAHVRIAVRNAIEGQDLSRLQERVQTEFHQQDEEERNARSALARLEASMVRRFRDLEAMGR